MNNLIKTSVFVFFGFSLSSVAHAVVVNYTDLGAFNSSLNSESIIRFNEVAQGTSLGSQFANLGVFFTDLNDTTLADAAFLSDGIGLDGHGSVALHFSSPLTAIGALFPGAMTIQLLSDGVSVGNSLSFGGQGENFFGGLISAVPFNEVILSDPSDGNVFLDNLYFNESPAPNVPDSGGTGALLTSSVAVMAFLARHLRGDQKSEWPGIEPQ